MAVAGRCRPFPFLCCTPMWTKLVLQADIDLFALILQADTDFFEVFRSMWTEILKLLLAEVEPPILFTG